MTEIASEATEAASPKIARIVTDIPREKMVRLQFPIEFGGELFEELRIRRVTGAEIAEYMDAVGRNEKAIPPTFAFPREVYEALDDDDLLTIEEAAYAFLPRRLRVAAGAAVSSPPPGDDTSGS